MQEYLVHTCRPNCGIHFFYRVRAEAEEFAFLRLQAAGAIDQDEKHIETFPAGLGYESHELVAIFHRGAKDPRAIRA